MIGEPVLLQSGSFTVPNGKVLYLTSADREIILNGKMHPTTPNMPAVPQGNTIDNCQCTGMLFDVTPTVDVKFHDFNAASTLIVPQNKILFLKSGLLGDDPAIIEVNNITMTFARANDTRGTRIPIFPEGTILSRPLIIPSMSITYYLIDKL